MRPPFGQLAQLVEQRIENPRVRGSIPRLATTEFSLKLKGKTPTPKRLAFCIVECVVRASVFIPVRTISF